MLKDNLFRSNDIILVTGAGGYIGSRVVKTALSFGPVHLRCFIRPSANIGFFSSLQKEYPRSQLEIMTGNLLSHEDCRRATRDVTIIYNLAAGNDKTFAGCFMNSVISTRNILQATKDSPSLKKFIHISSLAVYSNKGLKRRSVIDEDCSVDDNIASRYEPYTFGKFKQDELVINWCSQYNIPFVILRPGYVIGPGKKAIPSRVGIDTFGIFLHLGGRNHIPLTYVDNCAEAIVLAGLMEKATGEILNIIDDDLPTSRKLLRLYKREVGRFFSIPIPYSLFYLFSYAWEAYSKHTKGQFPPAFNRNRCRTYWKGNRYSNRKAKSLLDWSPKVSMKEALALYMQYQKHNGGK